MKQISLTMTGYFDKGKKTRREQFGGDGASAAVGAAVRVD